MKWIHLTSIVEGTQMDVQGEISMPQIQQVNYTPPLQQDKSEGFDSCDGPSNLAEIGFKSSIFQPVWPWNLMDDLEKQ